MSALTPSQIVAELDRYIVGQHRAKRAVAIALRNRWRRQNLPPELRDEVAPKNIIMIGPTGVGKTEIARRLARLAQAPFLKVEASKYTEVGYVGRDVESMIRDLTELSVNMVKAELAAEVRERRDRTRAKFRQLLQDGKLEDREVEVEVTQSMPIENMMIPMGGMDGGMDSNLMDMLQDVLPKKSKRRTVTVSEARRILLQDELDKLVNMDEVVNEALDRVEEMGIIFLDEIDKIAGDHAGMGPDVSREGVQRDLLPVVEGSTVQTKYGIVRTDHILFIAAGAFHVSKPSDLIPELQGRFPIRVELKSLTVADFVRILTEPKNALITQYRALVAAEGAKLEFTPDGVDEIARIAAHVNDRMENIGARRLHTVLTTLLEDILFELPEMEQKEITIDAETVVDKVLIVGC